MRAKFFFTITLLSLIFSCPVAADAQSLKALLEAGENGYVPETTCTKGTPRAGAAKVLVVVRDNDEALLVGARGDRVMWQKALPLKGEVNRAKTDPSCEGRKIELYSQAPFSAHTTIQTFSWDGARVRYVSTRYEDISADFIERAVGAAERGDAKAVRAIFDEGGKEEGNIDILYPGRYISGASLAGAIERSHAAATKLYKAGRPREAADRLALMFDVTTYLGAYMSAGGESKLTPEKWLESWKAIEMEAKDFVAPLNDHGYFLQAAGEHARAVKIFEAVVARDPHRAAARLNLADSLWALDRKDEAREHYKTYRELMDAAKKSGNVPPRVGERLK